MIALLDENISHHIAQAGRHVGLQMHHVTESMGPGRGTPDTVMFNWLRDQGPDWALITMDIRQTRRPHEYHLMRSCRLAVFVLTGKRAYEQHVIAESIFRVWNQMKLLVAKPDRPLVMTFSPTNALRELR